MDTTTQDFLTAPDITEKWSEMPEFERNLNKREYRNAMAGKDLIKLWSKLNPIEQNALYGMYREQYKKQRKIFAKKDTIKDTTVQMDTFNQRFILHIMNRFAPRGYKFVIVGPERKIAMYSSEIMGDQAPHGAFISDISFDLIEGVYGTLFKQDSSAAYDDTIFWRMRMFLPTKPYRTTKEKHAKYVKTIEKLSEAKSVFIESVSKKNIPMTRYAQNNAIIVQGIMDSGKPAPKYMQDNLHNTVNNIVWVAFRQAMRKIRATKLIKHRKSYKRKMNQLGVKPGQFSEFTKWRNNIDLQKSIKIRQHLEELRYDALPAAVNEKNNSRVLEIKKEITQLEAQLGADYKITQKPARSLLKDTFYVKQKINSNDKKTETVERKFPANMSTVKQMWLIATARKQKIK